jgi:hypothetical protein
VRVVTMAVMMVVMMVVMMDSEKVDMMALMK